jgi:ABC-type transport system involved in multi-copper enzyme maturation permease subunit
MGGGFDGLKRRDTALFIGPVFTREATIAPRRPRFYLARAVYVLALLVLMGTAWMVLTGTQLIRDVGDTARFGGILFQILATLQLALAVFFAALAAASAVAEEKDRRTMELLLLTHLSNAELVLGRLGASLLGVAVLLLAALPLFLLAALAGGVSYAQIAWVFAVTLASIAACGSLGSTLALWREKTFQAVALTVLVLVLWLALWEVVASGVLGSAWLTVPTATWAAWFSPWRAIDAAIHPVVGRSVAELARSPAAVFVMVAAGLSVVLNAVAIVRVRSWNLAREPRLEKEAEAQPTTAPAMPGATREVWDNPVIWREIRTWAYGRRMLVIRVAYLLLFALAAANLQGVIQADPAARPSLAMALVPLFLLSLVLVNAQAVTSITSERDARALDLLLVTDLSPLEIVFGKLGGVLYNTKEMILLPMLLTAYVWWSGLMSLENTVYVLGGLAVLFAFVAVLGLHAGIVYDNSRAAIATSLGTVFFLLLGVATCMRIMIAFSGSFQAQLQPFLAFMLGGGVGLYMALGARNPSAAIGVAAFVCPLATFYAITSYLLDYTLAVFLVTAAAYGFTTAAMLVPAIYEFDVATGRTTGE